VRLQRLQPLGQERKRLLGLLRLHQLEELLAVEQVEAVPLRLARAGFHDERCRELPLAFEQRAPELLQLRPLRHGFSVTQLCFVGDHSGAGVQALRPQVLRNHTKNVLGDLRMARIEGVLRVQQRHQRARVYLQPAVGHARR
jgi:hypothetical protein